MGVFKTKTDSPKASAFAFGGFGLDSIRWPIMCCTVGLVLWWQWRRHQGQKKAEMASKWKKFEKNWENEKVSGSMPQATAALPRQKGGAERSVQSMLDNMDYDEGDEEEQDMMNKLSGRQQELLAKRSRQEQAINQQ